MSTREHLAAIGRRIEQLEAVAPPAERERMRGLVHGLLEAHREGLSRALSFLDAADVERLCADADVCALLMLHGLHPLPLRTRVEQAVSALIPRLAAQHAELQLAGVDDDGCVRLTLEHRGQRGALHATIEEALGLAAADASAILIDESIAVPVRLEGLAR